MAKKELSKLEQNNKIWSQVKDLELKIEDLKKELHPAELPKQATLNECNQLARKTNVKPVKVDPKKISAEKGV